MLTAVHHQVGQWFGCVIVALNLPAFAIDVDQGASELVVAADGAYIEAMHLRKTVGRDQIPNSSVTVCADRPMAHARHIGSVSGFLKEDITTSSVTTHQQRVEPGRFGG